MQSLYPTTPAELSTDDLVELYAYPAEQRWARGNMVCTVDGAAHGADLKSGSISGQADRELFALLRSLSDVIVVGAGTARAEGYLPVRPDEVDGEVRAALGLVHTPTIAVVSRRLDIDSALLAGGAAPTIVMTSEASDAARRTALREQVELVVAGRDAVDFHEVFDALAGMGLNRVLVEGGPSVTRELCATRALDELCLTVSPLIAAGERKRVTSGPDLLPAAGLHLRHVLEEDGTLFLRYLLDRERQPLGS